MNRIAIYNFFNCLNKNICYIFLFYVDNSPPRILITNKRARNFVLLSFEYIMGLKSDIKKKEEYYKREIQKWEVRILISVFVLLLFMIALFILQLELCQWKLELINFQLGFYLRFLLTSPIIFYLLFSTKQYGKNRKIFNQYTNKLTTYLAIKELKLIK